MTQQNSISDNKLFSIGDASLYLGVSIDTLRRWVKAGKLEARRSPGGHRYFIKDDLDGVFNTVYERYQDSPFTKSAKEKHKEIEETNSEATGETADETTINTEALESRTEVLTETVQNSNIITETIHIEQVFTREIPMYEKNAVVLERPSRPIYVPAVMPIPVIITRKPSLYPTSRSFDTKNQTNPESPQKTIELAEDKIETVSELQVVSDVTPSNNSAKNILHPIDIVSTKESASEKPIIEQEVNRKSDKKMYILIVIGVFILIDIIALLVWIFNTRVV